MFTNNYYKLLAMINGKSGGASIQGVRYGGTAYDMQGITNGLDLTAATANYAKPSMRFMQTSLGGNGGVIIGTGTIPPAPTDYKLSGDMITSFSYSTAEFSCVADAEGMTISAKYSITNTGTEAFTIGEIGLMAHTSYSSESDTGDNKFLFERTLLDSPVTIEAGGSGQVTYTIRINYPTA